jgi:hypothetical protein
VNAQLPTGRSLGFSDLAHLLTGRSLGFSDLAQLPTGRSLSFSDLAQLPTDQELGASARTPNVARRVAFRRRVVHAAKGVLGGDVGDGLGHVRSTSGGVTAARLARMDRGTILASSTCSLVVSRQVAARTAASGLDF